MAQAPPVVEYKYCDGCRLMANADDFCTLCTACEECCTCTKGADE